MANKTRKTQSNLGSSSTSSSSGGGGGSGRSGCRAAASLSLLLLLIALLSLLSDGAEASLHLLFRALGAADSATDGLVDGEMVGAAGVARKQAAMG